MAAQLIKTQTVLHIDLESLESSKEYNLVTFDNIEALHEDGEGTIDVSQCKSTMISLDVWKDLGYPKEITMTIQPGDQLTLLGVDGVKVEGATELGEGRPATRKYI